MASFSSSYRLDANRVWFIAVQMYNGSTESKLFIQNCTNFTHRSRASV